MKPFNQHDCYEEVWGEGQHQCECHERTHSPQFIVLTGGPGAGKTDVLKLVQQMFCPHITIIPEAASIVFGGGFFRRDTLPAQKGAQRTIFKVQQELERITLEEQTAAIAICDRGTIDGLAYWPESDLSFWEDIGSTKQGELSRYKAVIHLRTPYLSQGYNLKNPVRIESEHEAQILDQKLLNIWSEHPNHYIIKAEDDFSSKALKALTTIQMFLPECCYQENFQSKFKEIIETI